MEHVKSITWMLILPLFRRQPKTKNVVSGTEIVIVIRTVNASVAAAVKNKKSQNTILLLFRRATTSKSIITKLLQEKRFTNKTKILFSYFFIRLYYRHISHAYTYTSHSSVIFVIPENPIERKFNLYPLTFDLTSKNENKITLINLLQAVPLFT